MEGLEIIGFTPPPSCYNLVNCTTGAVDYVINGTANGVDLSANVNQYVGQITIAGTTYYGCWNIQVSFDCTGYRTDLELTQLADSSDAVDYCGCPNGYTFNEDSGLCELSEPAEQPVIVLNALSADIPGLIGTNYSKYGAVIYDDITNAIFPIIATPQPAGNPVVQNCNTIIPPAVTPHTLVTTGNDIPWPPVLSPPIPQDFNSFNKSFRENVGTGAAIQPVESVVSQAWYNTSPWPPPTPPTPYTILYTWLSKYGLNITAPGTSGVVGNIPVRTWIGFNTCLEVTTETTYCLAMAADNAVRLFINGDLKIELNVGNSEIFSSGYVHVFPITLQPGIYQVRIEGLNYSTTGAFALGIYDVDPITLATYTLPSQLDAVKIFVTSDLVGQPYQTSSNPQYGYTCVTGVLNTCDGYDCVSTAPFRPCCYQLIKCDGTVEYQINYNGIQQTGIPAPGTILPPQVITSLTFMIDGNPSTITGCWTLQAAQCDPMLPEYNWEDVQLINLTASCETCNPEYYTLNDCTTNEPYEYNNQVVYLSYTGNCYTGTCPTDIGTQIITSITNESIGEITGCFSLTKIQKLPDGEVASAYQTFVQEITLVDTCAICNPPCYLLTDCTDPNNTIVVSGDLSQYVGYVINLAGCDSICWIVSLADSCEGSAPVPPITNSYAPISGAPLDKCCYKYGKVSSFAGTIEINSDTYNLSSTNLIDLINEITALGFGTCVLSDPGNGSDFGMVICIIGISDYGPLTFNNGDKITTQSCSYDTVVKFCNYTSYQIPFGQNVIVNVTINGIGYVSLVLPTVTGFEIVNYLNSLGLGLFSMNFSGITPPILGTIYVEGVNNYGSIILTNANTGQPITTLYFDDCLGAVINCEECLPDPPEPTPFTLHTRKVKPGYDTKGCPPEYTEKVLCNYAEQAFDEMAKARYGIKICCEKDFDYWDIKKQILELKALYDEDICQVQFPCKCYSLSNSNPTTPTLFNYSDCNAKYLTISVTQADGIVKVCATNVPVGMGGTPTVVLNGLCQDEICP